MSLIQNRESMALVRAKLNASINPFGSRGEFEGAVIPDAVLMVYVIEDGDIYRLVRDPVGDWVDGSGSQWVATIDAAIPAGRVASEAAAAANSAAAAAASAVLAGVSETEAAGAAAAAIAAANRIGYALQPTGGMDIAGPLAEALADNPVVIVPPGVYSLGSTVVLPSNRLLRMDGVTLTHTVPQIFTASGAVRSAIVGGEIIGPHSGTSYQIIFTDCLACVIQTAMRNGNSGIHLLRSEGCVLDVDMAEMRGTGIRLSGAPRNRVAVRRGRNISGFGIYLATDSGIGSEGNKLYAEKYADGATLTAYQNSGGTEPAFYAPLTGRIGLEGIGITIGNDGNRLSGNIRNTNDNGVSVTSDHNSGSDLILDGNGHDGLHVYGASNTFTGVLARRNGRSGIGISKSDTNGLASRNSVQGTSVENAHYGVRIGAPGTGNIVNVATGTSNGLGKVLKEEGTAANMVVSAEAEESAAAQVSFLGVSDLAPNYSLRTAKFRSDMQWCNFSMTLRFTPNYTQPVVPGEFRISIPGLPQASATPVLMVGSVSGLVWPAGATQLVGRFESGSVMRIRASGPNMSAVSLTSAHFISGTQVEMTITGSYPLA